MFQKKSLTAARLAVSSLTALSIVALGGCAGMQMGTDSQASRAVAGDYQGNETLAVLLPQSGRYAGAAKVVRDGIVAAHQADPQGKRPELRFYDSTSGSATALVKQAAADGASLAIGPLQKRTVNELRARPPFRSPSSP